MKYLIVLLIVFVSCENQMVYEDDLSFEYSLSSSFAPARCCVWTNYPTKDLEVNFNEVKVEQHRKKLARIDTLCFLVEESKNYDLIVSSDEFGFMERIELPNIKRPNTLVLNSIKYSSDVYSFQPKIFEMEYRDLSERVILNDYEYFHDDENKEIVFVEPLKFAFNIDNEFGLTITINDELKSLTLWVDFNSNVIYSQRIPFVNAPMLDNSYLLRVSGGNQNEYNFNFFGQIEWE
ncbi:MAG: hypothetical protein ACPGR7_05230 [Flavobacteriaceae bacterium]